MADLGNADRNHGLAQSDYIHRDRGPAPHYTTNLQDAVSLLGAGEEYEISTLYGVAHVALPLNTNDPDGPYEASRKDDNVCLAFCECIIKAQASKEAEAA